MFSGFDRNDWTIKPSTFFMIISVVYVNIITAFSSATGLTPNFWQLFEEGLLVVQMFIFMIASHYARKAEHRMANQHRAAADVTQPNQE